MIRTLRRTTSPTKEQLTVQLNRLKADRIVMWRALCRIAEGAGSGTGDPTLTARDAINAVSA